MVKQIDDIQGTEKEFLSIFKELCYCRGCREVWADLITVMACTISNAVDKIPEHFEKREKEYGDCIKRLGSVEQVSEIFAVTVMALERNPNQDFLGEMYMSLELGSKWNGQFFTPYDVSRMMAEINFGDCKEQVENKGWISVCDPCVGSGAMLIAAANVAKSKNVNYQNSILFAGQDIDRVVAMMAYIQISLLGCPGYIVVGNTLTNPLTGSVLFPREMEGQEYWYTPMFISDVWSFRRLFNSLNFNCKTKIAEKANDKKRGFFIFFNLEEGGYYGKECFNKAER